MDYFSKINAALLKIFPQTKSTAVKAEDVGNYLSALKKKGKDATIHELSEKFGVDEFKMVNIIGDLESAGKALLNGFTPVYREDGGLIHLARYTGAVKEQ